MIIKSFRKREREREEAVMSKLLCILLVSLTCFFQKASLADELLFQCGVVKYKLSKSLMNKSFDYREGGLWKPVCETDYRVVDFGEFISAWKSEGVFLEDSFVCVDGSWSHFKDDDVGIQNELIVNEVVYDFVFKTKSVTSYLKKNTSPD